MRVERSTLDQVQARMEHHKRKKEETEAVMPTFQERVALREEEEEAERAARKERKLEKKKEKEKVLAIEAAPEGEGMDPEMMAMMGFSGFSTAIKKT